MPHPTDPTDTFWDYAARGRASEFPSSLGPYNSFRNYVGPQSTQWVLKNITRYIWGVDFNKPAYRHDFHYSVGGSKSDRLDADATFLRELKAEIHKTYPSGSGPWAAFKRLAALRAAREAWVMVRKSGAAFYNFTTPKEGPSE